MVLSRRGHLRPEARRLPVLAAVVWKQGVGCGFRVAYSRVDSISLA